MLFIITTLLILTSVILLRNRKVLLGYILFALGWACALFQSAAVDRSVGASLIVLLIALAFFWFVKVKMEKHWTQGVYNDNHRRS